MTPEEILEQLFDTNSVKTTITLKDKFKYTIRNLTPEDYLSLDSIIADTKSTRLTIYQKYGLAKLARVLLSYNDKTFNDYESAYSFLMKMPSSIIDTLSAKQKEFEDQIKSALTVENIQESFFEIPGSEEKPGQ